MHKHVSWVLTHTLFVFCSGQIDGNHAEVKLAATTFILTDKGNEKPGNRILGAEIKVW
jgi:hypothetical protein